MASENGWQPAWVGPESLQWTKVPGTNVSLQIQKGWPLAILRAFAADFNAYVEPLRDADSACYTPTNSVSTSNHLNGTAMDLNWNSHPFRILNAGFTSQQINTIRDLLDFYEDTVFWGNDWNTPKDAMHFQCGYDTYGNPHTGDFIARKIRADGFSTFRRGNEVEVPPKSDQSRVLAEATGLPLARAQQILPAVKDGLRLSECTNVRRIAMWLAQIGHESDNFHATEEYAKNGRYAPYIGRTWIQITWRDNYAAFGQWCMDHGLLDDPAYADRFVDNPKELADQRWAGIGPAWYWTVARKDINELADRADLETVTQRINGGDNGISDRRARYNRALAVGDDLLQLVSVEHEPTIEELLMSDQLYPSVSIYATPGEGPKYTLAQLIQSIDGMRHRETVENDAKLGDQDALARIVRVAAGRGAYTDPSSVAHAKSVLASIEASNPDILKQFLAKG